MDWHLITAPEWTQSVDHAPLIEGLDVKEIRIQESYVVAVRCMDPSHVLASLSARILQTVLGHAHNLETNGREDELRQTFTKQAPGWKGSFFQYAHIDGVSVMNP